MKQLTLATAGFERYAKTTRRATFLAEMEQVVPWRRLCRLIEPVYPKAGNGRPPVGLERMLRIYFLQHWFNLSDPAVEEALYDSLSMRRFVGIDDPASSAPHGARRSPRIDLGCFQGGYRLLLTMGAAPVQGPGQRDEAACGSKSGMTRSKCHRRAPSGMPG